MIIRRIKDNKLFDCVYDMYKDRYIIQSGDLIESTVTGPALRCLLYDDNYKEFKLIEADDLLDKSCHSCINKSKDTICDKCKKYSMYKKA